VDFATGNRICLRPRGRTIDSRLRLLAIDSTQLTSATVIANGSASLIRVLYLATIVAIRHNPTSLKEHRVATIQKKEIANLQFLRFTYWRKLIPPLTPLKFFGVSKRIFISMRLTIKTWQRVTCIARSRTGPLMRHHPVRRAWARP